MESNGNQTFCTLWHLVRAKSDTKSGVMYFWKTSNINQIRGKKLSTEECITGK